MFYLEFVVMAMRPETPKIAKKAQARWDDFLMKMEAKRMVENGCPQSSSDRHTFVYISCYNNELVELITSQPLPSDP